jgi:hypothetical protein
LAAKENFNSIVQQKQKNKFEPAFSTKTREETARNATLRQQNNCCGGISLKSTISQLEMSPCIQ